jgi:hypothetical protein
MQIAPSHTLLVPLWVGTPRAESVASCLVDRMSFITLQVRTEQTAACVSFFMMIPPSKAYDYTEPHDATIPSEDFLDTFIPPKTRRD